jgi:NDP-sugar pyrophosphorylase family protein
MLNRKVNKGIILAAGDGDRLGYLTLTCPKVLLPVSEEAPLISYPIEALAAAGISDIAIVVGYLGDKIIASGLSTLSIQIISEAMPSQYIRLESGPKRNRLSSVWVTI